MTVIQLYKWLKEKGAEEYEVRIKYDAQECDFSIEKEDIEIDDENQRVFIKS